MYYAKEELLELLNIAVENFNAEEEYLIKNNLSERCICARFAMYLQQILFDNNLNDYKVDVEYNRGNNGRDNNAKILDDKQIVVDLIVHKRGFDQNFGFDNLICIEMKKEYSNKGLKDDLERLKKLTNYSYGFNYKLGAMIMIRKKRNENGLFIFKSFPSFDYH